MAAGKSLGSGYMPGGEAMAAQADAARRSAAIKGHALTPGRFLASSVVEPGTAPYNLLSGVMDATVAWKLDPTAAVLKKSSVARANAARFLPSEQELRTLAAQDAGLVDGARKTIIGEKVDAWLGSKRGEKALQWFADNDFETIRRGLGGDKVDVGIVKDLADARTIEEVDAILRPSLGLKAGLETRPKVGGFGMEVKRKAADLPFFEKVADSRLVKELPTGRIKYDDPTDATHQFELLMRDANLSPEAAAGFTRPFAEALMDGSFAGRRQADQIVYRALGGAKGKVAQSDAGRSFMNKVARRAGASDAEVLRSLMDEDITKTPIPGVSLGGVTQKVAPASYLTDYMDMGVDIDRSTLRGIRNATSKYARVMSSEKIQTPVTFLNHVTNDMWKPTALLRGAWTVRVVGEEQIRMAASGRLSLFNHPLSYLAWAMDDGDGRIAQIFQKHGRSIGGRGSTDVLGERFAKEGSTIIPDADALERELRDEASKFGEATNWKHQNEGWQGDGFAAEVHRETYIKGAAGHVEAVAENIDDAFSDPLVRMLATSPTNVVRDWFMTGEGNQIRQALINKHGAPLQSRADVDKAIQGARRKLNSILGKVDDVPTPTRGLTAGGMSTEEVATLQATRKAVRPGSPQVRDAIATGELNGVPIRDSRGRINKDFLAELKKVENLPDQMVGSAARHDTKWAAKPRRRHPGPLHQPDDSTVGQAEPLPDVPPELLGRGQEPHDRARPGRPAAPHQQRQGGQATEGRHRSSRVAQAGRLGRGHPP